MFDIYLYIFSFYIGVCKRKSSFNFFNFSTYFFLCTSTHLTWNFQEKIKFFNVLSFSEIYMCPLAFWFWKKKNQLFYFFELGTFTLEFWKKKIKFFNVLKFLKYICAHVPSDFERKINIFNFWTFVTYICVHLPSIFLKEKINS